MIDQRIRNQPAPRLCAASVSVRTSIARRPVSTARYMYGSDRIDVGRDEQDVAAARRESVERQRTACCRPDQPEDEDDRRDDERQQRDELDDRPEARQAEPDPVRGRHDQDDADDDR